jgi:hypothetical protein
MISRLLLPYFKFEHLLGLWEKDAKTGGFMLVQPIHHLSSGQQTLEWNVSYSRRLPAMCGSWLSLNTGKDADIKA